MASGDRSDRRQGSSGSGSGGKRPRKVRGQRIPPPPVIRDDIRVERLDDDPKTKGTKNGKRSKGSKDRASVDVKHVRFDGVPTATAEKLQRRLAEAALAFDAERFKEADNLLASIERLAPGAVEVDELRGLTYYRLGRWQKAIDQLERFSTITGSVEQHPVLADCHRAMRRWGRAEELWEELRDASPSAELVEEGRIVQAGGLADRGRLDEAIKTLEKAPKAPRQPGVHHLRRWYMLADLYERSGDLARARRVFGDILAVDSDFGDVAERAAAVG